MVFEDFYKERANELLKELADSRIGRTKILQTLVDIENKNLSREQIDRLRIVLTYLLDDEKHVADRVYGKPVAMIQAKGKLISLDDDEPESRLKEEPSTYDSTRTD